MWLVHKPHCWRASTAWKHLEHNGCIWNILIVACLHLVISSRLAEQLSRVNDEARSTFKLEKRFSTKKLICVSDLINEIQSLHFLLQLNDSRRHLLALSFGIIHWTKGSVLGKTTTGRASFRDVRRSDNRSSHMLGILLYLQNEIKETSAIRPLTYVGFWRISPTMSVDRHSYNLSHYCMYCIEDDYRACNRQRTCIFYSLLELDALWYLLVCATKLPRFSFPGHASKFSGATGTFGPLNSGTT